MCWLSQRFRPFVQFENLFSNINNTFVKWSTIFRCAQRKAQSSAEAGANNGDFLIEGTLWRALDLIGASDRMPEAVRPWNEYPSARTLTGCEKRTMRWGWLIRRRVRWECECECDATASASDNWRVAIREHNPFGRQTFDLCGKCDRDATHLPTIGSDRVEVGLGWD